MDFPRNDVYCTSILHFKLHDKLRTPLKDGTDSVHEKFCSVWNLDEGDSTMFQQHKPSELKFVHSFVSC